ncbi:MAG: transposase [Spirosomataceae bacterium]
MPKKSLQSNVASSHFTCSAGKQLPFKTFATQAEGGGLKIYRADYQDCKNCPLKPTCVPKRWFAAATMSTDYPDCL